MIHPTLMLVHLNKIDNKAEIIGKVYKDKLFYITDINGESSISLSCDCSDNTFTIKNNNSKNIGFVPIDGKGGLLGFGVSYCDAIIFNDSLFVFLEFKLNATSLTSRAVRKNRKKAVSQLSNTIDLFDNKLDKDYKGLKLEAYVSTPITYPRADTGWQSFEVEFLEKYGIPLYEDISKEL